jgi:hypothetical protein
VANLKRKDLIGGSVAMSFCHRLIQPIKDRVHPTYEYWGQSDPTHEANCKVSQEEMATRVTQLYTGWIKQRNYPKAHSLTRPAGPVSLGLTSSSLKCLFPLCLGGRPHRPCFLSFPGSGDAVQKDRYGEPGRGE